MNRINRSISNGLALAEKLAHNLIYVYDSPQEVQQVDSNHLHASLPLGFDSLAPILSAALTFPCAFASSAALAYLALQVTCYQEHDQLSALVAACSGTQLQQI